LPLPLLLCAGLLASALLSLCVLWFPSKYLLYFLFSSIDQGDAKNAHRFYELTIKVLKPYGSALKELSIEELEKRLTKLEASLGEA